MSGCSRLLSALVLVACVEKPLQSSPAASRNECTRPETGCACDPGTAPVACFEPDEIDQDGEVTCREGTRRCEDAYWSACRDVRSYPASARTGHGKAALI